MDDRTTVDPASLSEGQVRQAIKNHCFRMGSKLYYQRDEIGWWKAHPKDLVVYEDDGQLYAYHRRIVRR